MALPQIFPSFLIFLPPFLSIIGLLFLAFVVEKFYVSRVTILANAFLLWQLFVPVWLLLNDYLQIYVYVSVFFAALAAVSYIRKSPLDKLFYGISYALYSSKTVLGLYAGMSLASFIGLGTDGGIAGGVIMALIIWLAAVVLLKHKPPFTK